MRIAFIFYPNESSFTLLYINTLHFKNQANVLSHRPKNNNNKETVHLFKSKRDFCFVLYEKKEINE